MSYKKWPNNLRTEGNKVISYVTHVATMDGNKLIRHKNPDSITGKWSATTNRHINFIASHYDLEIIDGANNNQGEKNPFSSVAMVASLAKIFTETKEESNAWKLRMILAGTPKGAIFLPENWETLTEDEKETRLDKVIEVMKINLPTK